MTDKEKIAELEKRILELENRNQILGPRYKPCGGDPWGGQPRITDGPDSYWPKNDIPVGVKEFLDAIKKERNKEYPLFEKKICPECGLEMAGTMGYVCPRHNCPTGMGPILCSG